MPKNHAGQWIAYAEANRREKRGGFSTAPVCVPPTAGEQAIQVIDYAEPLLHMKQAAQHLDEALPTAQLERTLAAYRAMKEALGEMEVWLRLNGVLSRAAEH